MMHADDHAPHIPEGYRIVRGLGRQGVFDVGLAAPLGGGALVEIKSLARVFLHDLELQHALEREAIVLAGSQHPNLVRLIGLSREGGHYDLILDWTEGVTLAELLDYVRAHKRKLHPLVAVLVAADILSGLAHFQTLVRRDGAWTDGGGAHRNVTPSNVRVSIRGDVRLGDPGVERSRFGRSARGLAALRSRLPYMAPEELRGDPVTSRADDYAVALILFELLTGERYLLAESELRLRILAEEPGQFSSSSRSAHPAFDSILDVALSAAIEERFPSTEAFARALSDAARSIRGRGRRRDLADLAAEVVSHRLRVTSRGSSGSGENARLRVVSKVVLSLLLALLLALLGLTLTALLS